MVTPYVLVGNLLFSSYWQRTQELKRAQHFLETHGFPERNRGYQEGKALAIPFGKSMYQTLFILPSKPPSLRPVEWNGHSFPGDSAVSFFKVGTTHIRQFTTTADQLGIELFLPSQVFEIMRHGDSLPQGEPMDQERLRWSVYPAKWVPTEEEALHEDPDLYQRIKEKISAESLDLEQVTSKLKELFPTTRVVARRKTPESAFSSAKRYSYPTLDSIPDYNGARIICQTPDQCYQILHAIARSIFEPDRVKDLIAYPFPNGYQSLHAHGSFQGKPLEIQIRTEKMDHTAEHGTAANYRVKRQLT